MLDLLHMVESSLDVLLTGERSDLWGPNTTILPIWKTKKIDYTPPLVHRIYRDWEYNGVIYRIYLHKIYPCPVKSDGIAQEALYHLHPWASAIRNLGGCGKVSVYEMGVGYGLSNRSPLAATIRVSAGFEYEMLDPLGRHFVNILENPSYSLMVTSPPFADSAAPRTDNLKLVPLSEEAQNDLLTTVCRCYFNKDFCRYLTSR